MTSLIDTTLVVLALLNLPLTLLYSRREPQLRKAAVRKMPPR